MTDSIITEILSHIATINDELNGIEVKLAILTERVDWLVRFFWILVSTTISTLLINIWQSYRIHKNGRNNRR